MSILISRSLLRHVVNCQIIHFKSFFIHLLGVPVIIECTLLFLYQDVITKILDLMEGKPDLIIGNYTDGNLAATLMAGKLGVTQATIAHALEKTKYEDSDVKWKELDAKYHFPCQFMADTVAMNATDFIIASTYQEIAGRLENYPRFSE